MTRREQMKALLGLAASSDMPEIPVPPQGIGRRIRHISYSEIGGLPDRVQIMVNRKHLYVSHMFSNGVTILDAGAG